MHEKKRGLAKKHALPLGENSRRELSIEQGVRRSSQPIINRSFAIGDVAELQKGSPYASRFALQQLMGSDSRLHVKHDA